MVGFCLGGNFVLELARRKTEAKLVAFYPFPAGLDNQDQIAPLIDYAESLTQAVTVITGALDASAGEQTISDISIRAENIDALEMVLYKNSGHGFLANLDSEIDALRDEATDALKKCELVITV